MLISVYLPTRNRQAQLRRAVESVMAQTHVDFELIVVDDGSSDATAGYLQGLASADARVRVVRNENSRGAPASRNVALAMARGEWVTGLDDDDEFLPRRLELLAAYAGFLDGTGCRFSGVYAQDQVRVSDDEQARSNKRGPVLFEDLFSSNLIGNQIFARRSAVLEVGGFDEALPAWQDLDFLMRLTRRFGPAQLLDVPLYLFDDRPRADRISTQRKQRLLDSHRVIVEKYPGLPSKLKQLLYLQAFSPSYGHIPNLGDACRFFRMGFSGPAAWQLVRLVVRRGAHELVPPVLQAPRLW